MKHKKKRFSKLEEFLIKKYSEYIRKTLFRMSNREHNFEDFLWKDNDFNIETKKKMMKSEIYIDEKSLFKSLADAMKKDNMHCISPHIFAEAIKRIIRGNEEFNDFGPFFFLCNETFCMEKMRINGKPLLKVIF